MADPVGPVHGWNFTASLAKAVQLPWAYSKPGQVKSQHDFDEQPNISGIICLQSLSVKNYP